MRLRHSRARLFAATAIAWSTAAAAPAVDLDATNAEPTTSESIAAIPSAFSTDADDEGDMEGVLAPLPLPAAPEAASDADAKDRPVWVRRWMAPRSKGGPAPPAFFARFRRETPPSDSLLTSRCRAILLGEPSLKGVWIHVATENGVIYLRGTAPTESIRQAAETAARRTPGAVDVQNELVLSGPSTGGGGGYAAATLSAPQRLDGGDLRVGASAAPATNDVPPPANETAGAAPILVAPASDLPEVRTYVIHRPTAPLSPFAGPEQQFVAKTSPAPPVLPSGFRVLSAPGRRGVIPARGGPAASPIEIPVDWKTPAAAPAPAARIETGPAADVAAVLALDPRARNLEFSVRGSEVRMSGSIRSPEDLYDLSERISAVPGIDFVSFGEIEFTF
jgi:hypothetical protein